MLSPIAWLCMMFASGLLGGATPQVPHLKRGEGWPTTSASWLAFAQSFPS